MALAAGALKRAMIQPRLGARLEHAIAAVLDLGSRDDPGRRRCRRRGSGDHAGTRAGRDNPTSRDVFPAAYGRESTICPPNPPRQARNGCWIQAQWLPPNSVTGAASAVRGRPTGRGRRERRSGCRRACIHRAHRAARARPGPRPRSSSARDNGASGLPVVRRNSSTKVPPSMVIHFSCAACAMPVPPIASISNCS